jgi:hypothetical protein
MPVVRADSAQFPEAVLGRSASVSDDEADRTGTLKSAIPVRFHTTLRVTRLAAGSLWVITGHSVRCASKSSQSATESLAQTDHRSLPVAHHGLVRADHP